MASIVKYLSRASVKENPDVACVLPAARLSTWRHVSQVSKEDATMIWKQLRHRVNGASKFVCLFFHIFQSTVSKADLYGLCGLVGMKSRPIVYTESLFPVGPDGPEMVTVERILTCEESILQRLHVAEEKGLVVDLT